MTGKGTQLSPLGISQLTNLAVDDTMTAYSATIEGKDSLVLGVNGDWFYNEFGSAFSGKLDTSSFNSAYVGLKGDLSSKVDWSAMTSYYDKDETYNIFMPRSAIDLNNYYTKNETYNKEEITSFLDRKQDKLTFGYNEYNEINSINNSAIAGGQGGSSGDETPWISAADIISAIGYIQPGQTIQALSSIDVSGNKNHFIGMKGSKFIFPTVDMLSAWLDLSSVMAQSSFDNFYSAGYQPAINDLYNSANFNTTNKLDISSFNDWSAAYAPTTPSYEVSAGNWIDVVADDVEHVKVVSVTGLEEVISGVSATLDNKIDEVSSTLTNEFSSFSSTITGDLTGKKDKQSYTTFTAEEGQFITGLEQDTNGEIVSASFGGYSDISPAISSTEVIGATKPMSGDMLIQVLSSISLSGDKNHGIIMEGSVYRFPNNNELASGINQTNTFLTQSAFSSYSNAITDNLSILYGQDSYLSGRIDNLSGVLKSTSSTVNSNSGNWNGAYTACTSNSGEWEDVSITVHSNSASWNQVGLYVPLSAKNCTIGYNNVAIDSAFSQGYGNSAKYNSLAQGSANTAYAYSLAQGTKNSANNASLSQGGWNTAYDSSLAQGRTNSANREAFSQGESNKVYYESLGQGAGNKALNQSLAQGGGNYAYYETLSQGFGNSAQWDSLAQGVGNTAESESFSQGERNKALGNALSQGFTNSAETNSLAQGDSNKASAYSFSQGYRISAFDTSFSQGMRNSAFAKSLAQGSGNTALNYSLAQGIGNSANDYSLAQGFNCGAVNKSQALGFKVTATNSGMAIGKYNKITTAAFVVGNGYSAVNEYGEDTNYYSDCFIIYHDGSVSAAGKASANGVELGAGITFPISSTRVGINYYLNASSNYLSFTTANGAYGKTVTLDNDGVSYYAYPSTNVSSNWYDIIRTTNNSSNCYCLLLNPSNTSVNLENYSAYDKLTILHGKEYGSTYQIHWDGKTKEIPSGLYIEMGKVKDMNNLDKWTFLNSGWANNGWWDYD